MLWCYWLRGTDACERLKRVEEDKWRSADEEKKMTFSDKCVFEDTVVCWTNHMYVVYMDSCCLTQVVQVHQETVDLYLEDIILETLERTVDQQAREDIHRRAQEVNNTAHTTDDRSASRQQQHHYQGLIIATNHAAFVCNQPEQTSV